MISIRFSITGAAWVSLNGREEGPFDGMALARAVDQGYQRAAHDGAALVILEPIPGKPALRKPLL